MKFKFLRAVISVVLLSLLFVPIHAQAFPVARLRRVKPVVEVRGNAQSWLAARERSPLSYGQWVRTGARGGADVLFNNGTQLALRANTQIEIIAPPSATQPLVVRVVGALSEVFVRARGRTEIRTAAGTAAVRGTQYLVRLPTENSTVLTVLEGSVDFFNPQGAVIVAANQQSEAEVGRAPSAPVAVDASGLIQWTTELTGVPIEWETQNFVASAGAQRALALRAAGDATAATAALNDAASADELAVRMLLVLDAGELGAVRAQFDAASDAQKTSGNVLAVRAFAALQSGGGALEAEAFGRRAIEVAPNIPAAHSTLALALVQNGRTREAVAAARRAVVLAPNSAPSLSALAWAQFFNGETRGAGKNAQLALDRDALAPLALLVYGRTRLAAGERDEARRALGQAQALAPRSPVFNRDLGEVWLALDNLPRAEEAFRRAGEGGTAVTRAEALAGLGTTLAARGRNEEAETAFKSALELDAQSRAVRARYGAFLVERGRLAQAEPLLQGSLLASGRVRSNSTVLGDEQADGALLVRLSEVSLYQQNLRKAFDYARRAVEVLPHSALAHYQLGRVLFEEDRVIQAQSQFRLATVLDPNFAEARYALGITRQKIERGLLRFPRELLDSSPLGGPATASSIQNFLSPGADDRIQATIQDPTVVRSASRSIGDTEISGRIGGNGVRDATVSHIRDWSERRGVFGVSAEHTQNDGVRENADTQLERLGFVLGRKMKNSPSGAFLLGEYEKSETGGDRGFSINPFSFGTRSTLSTERLLGGYNFQPRDGQSTRVLLQSTAFNLYQSAALLPGQKEDLDIRSISAEVRHDVRLSEQNRLSAGFSFGVRERHSDSFVVSPFPILPDFLAQSNAKYRQAQAYIRDEMKVSDKLTVTGEMRVLRVNFRSVSRSVPAISGLPTSTKFDTTQGIPLLLIAYRPDAQSVVRFRARRIVGSIEDFQLLNPNDAFLLNNDELPQVAFGAFNSSARSFELEYDRSFGDASYLRLALVRQHQEANGIPLTGVGFDRSTLTTARASYESTLGRDLAYFVRSDINRARVTNGPFHPLVPEYAGAAGLQYLNPKGLFLQSVYVYNAQRRSNINPSLRRGGFGVLNLRTGKRRGLRSELFVEVNNVFNKEYEVINYLQPRRRASIGITQRF